MNWLGKTPEKKGVITTMPIIRATIVVRMGEGDLSYLIAKTQKERKQKYLANIYINLFRFK